MGEAHRGGGLALVGAGLLLMALMSEGDSLPFVLAGMVVGEFGFMLSNVPLTIAATSGAGEALVGGLRWGLLLCVGVVTLALPTLLLGLRGGRAARRRPPNTINPCRPAPSPGYRCSARRGPYSLPDRP